MRIRLLLHNKIFYPFELRYLTLRNEPPPLPPSPTPPHTPMDIYEQGSVRLNRHCLELRVPTPVSTQSVVLRTRSCSYFNQSSQSITMFSRLLFVLNISGCMASRPVITEHPQDIMVHRGAPTTLNCGAFGSPTPTISWFKDGERMFTGGGDHTVLLPGGGLFFLRTRHNHRSRDSGTYSCRAENEEGVVYSKSATLTVICKLKLLIPLIAKFLSLLAHPVLYRLGEIYWFNIGVKYLY